MKINKITLTINENMQELESVFVARSGAWAQLGQRFRTEYLPSAQNHYMNTGDITAINKILQAVNNGKNMAKFRPLLIKLSAHAYDKDKKRFVGKKNAKKFAALQKEDKQRGAPMWACHIVDFLLKEEAQNKAAQSKTFDQKWDALMTQVRNLSQKAETEEERQHVRQSLAELTA